jgi:hypothetical protein
MRDPLGGIKGDEFKASNPFAADKLTASKELNVSIDWFEGRKRKSDKPILQQCGRALGEQKKKYQIGSHLKRVSLTVSTLFSDGLAER